MYNNFSEYFNELIKADKDEQNAKKRALATELGMIKRTYAPDNVYSDEYPEAEKDYETSAVRYYREDPIEMTDSEYEKLTAYLGKKRKSKNNPVVICIKIIAILTLVLGVISFISLLSYNTDGTIVPNLSASLISTFINYVIRAGLYWGFAEIIRLLDNIHSKINN